MRNVLPEAIHAAPPSDSPPIYGGTQRPVDDPAYAFYDGSIWKPLLAFALGLTATAVGVVLAMTLVAAGSGPVGLVLLVSSVVLTGYGVFDAVTRPRAAWLNAGRSRKMWIRLQVGSVFIAPIGCVIPILYLAMIQPDLRAAGAEQRGE